MTIKDENNTRILRRKEVEHVTGYKRSSIYNMMQKGEFPESVSLGERAVGWLEDEIQEWVQNKLSNSRKIDSNGGQE